MIKNDSRSERVYSAQDYWTILEHHPDGLAFVNPVGSVAPLNNRARNILAANPRFAMVDGWGAGVFDQLTGEAVVTGEDGINRYIITVVKVGLEDGQMGALVVFRDVTAERESPDETDGRPGSSERNALSTVDASLNWNGNSAVIDFIESIPVAVASIGTDLRVIGSNVTFRALYGSEDGQILDCECFMEGLALKDAIHQVISSRETFTAYDCEATNPGWEGTYWTLSLTVGMVSPANIVKTVTLLAFDVTSEVQAEKRAERYAKQLAVIQGMQTALSAEEDYRTLLERFTMAAAELIDAENAALVLKGNGVWQWQVVYGREESNPIWGMDCLEKRVSPKSYCAHWLDRRRSSRKTIVLSDSGSAHRPRFVSVLAMPLIDKSGEVIGCLILGGKFENRVFTRSDEGLLSVLTSQGITIMQRMRELEKERGTVQILQEALTAKVPQVEGIVLDVVYRSSETVGVCGDFLDFIELTDGKLGIVVGDVCGRGVEAATVATMARHVIRTFAYEEEDPAEVITRSNRIIAAQLQPGRFVTVFYGILDSRTGLLRCVNAGHPPPMVYNRSLNDTHFLDFGLLPLGVLPDVKFEEISMRLDPEDIIVIYTDGLSEARRGDSLFGDEMSAIVATNGEDWQCFAESLVDEAIKFAGPIKDDIAVVAIALNPKGDFVRTTALT